jgi:divalent metal cation (Fe/Co/Zn/Cd) transporter
MSMNSSQPKVWEARRALKELVVELLDAEFPRNDVEYVCAAINNLDSLTRSWRLKEEEVRAGRE